MIGVSTVNGDSPQLQRCPVLAGLTKDELEAFLSLVHFEDFPSGADVLTEGLAYHGLWILLNGTCDVLKRGPHKWAKLATLEPGNVFGEMSFFDDATHSATVRAVTPVQTIRLMRDAYEQLRTRAPDAAYKIVFNLVEILSQRLRHMDDWTCKLVEKDCDESRHDEWQQFRAKLYSMKDL